MTVQTIFHMVAQGDLATAIVDLLKLGADVNWSDAAKWTALHLAVDKGNFKVVEALVVENADVNAETLQGLTPLDLSIKNNTQDITEYLLEKGARRGTPHRPSHK